MKRLNILAFCLLALTGFDLRAEGMPHVGADVSWRAVNFKGIKSHILSQHVPAFNAYLGLPFNERFHVEFGFHSINHRKGKAPLKMQGIHVSLVGNYPLVGNLSLLGGVGMVCVKLKNSDEILPFSIVHLAPRVLGGVEYKLKDNIGWRTTLSMENTKSIKHKSVNVKVKDTYAISTGLKLSF